MFHMSNPDAELLIFAQDSAHRQHVARHERLARIRSFTPGRHVGRAWLRVAMVGIAVTATAFAPGALSSDTNHLPVGACDVSGAYTPACRMVPGRPDGWFQPADLDGAVATNDAPLVPTARLR